MAQRFKTAPVPSGEVARYTSDPYNLSSIYMFGSSSPFTGQGNTIVRPNDDLLIQKGGNRALSVYQRLLYDEQVQGCFSKLVQEITSRPWYVEQYSEKPGDIAVRDFVSEVLEEIPLDDIYKGLAEAIITGFSVGEVMWKKTKRGVIPFDVRMRDQRRFGEVFPVTRVLAHRRPSLRGARLRPAPVAVRCARRRCRRPWRR